MNNVVERNKNRKGKSPVGSDWHIKVLALTIIPQQENFHRISYENFSQTSGACQMSVWKFNVVPRRQKIKIIC